MLYRFFYDFANALGNVIPARFQIPANHSESSTTTTAHQETAPNGDVTVETRQVKSTDTPVVPVLVSPTTLEPTRTL